MNCSLSKQTILKPRRALAYLTTPGASARSNLVNYRAYHLTTTAVDKLRSENLLCVRKYARDLCFYNFTNQFITHFFTMTVRNTSC